MLKTRKARHGSVPLGAPLTAAVHLRPRFVFHAHDWTSVPNAATTAIPLPDVSASVIVPVSHEVEGCRLQQVATDGWDRCLKPSRTPKTPDLFFFPVTISARGAWHLSNGNLSVFDRGYLLDGACRLETACRSGVPAMVPAIVLFQLTAAEELDLRSQLTATTTSHGTTAPSVNPRTAQQPDAMSPRIDTSTPRAEVSDRWVTFTVESEPFVVPTSRGYAPAILARRPGAAQRQHLLIGAKSLASPLERIRQSRKALTGQVIQVRKLGGEKTAPYELRTRSE